MAIQLARDGRRRLVAGPRVAPKNFTDRRDDPRKPSVIVQTDLPHGDMRSKQPRPRGRSTGGAVPDEPVGLKPAAVEFFDVSDPSKPKSVAFF